MFLIAFARNRYGATMAALIISILNTLVPYICKAITAFESHTQEGTKSTSRYIKITIFLFINTAIVTSLITPFTDSLSNDAGAITHSIYAIFVFELIRGPLIQLSDPAGFINRHILGPRTRNFRRMLVLFAGTPYELSERYTDMTNVIFLTFYYAIIFPAGFFFAAATLFVHYWTDKFCLLASFCFLLNNVIVSKRLFLHRIPYLHSASGPKRRRKEPEYRAFAGLSSWCHW